MKTKEELEQELDEARRDLKYIIDDLGNYSIVDKYVREKLIELLDKNACNSILAILLNKICKIGDVAADHPDAFEGAKDPLLVIQAIGKVQKVQRLSKELKSL